MSKTAINRTAELRRFMKLQLSTPIYPAGSRIPSVRILSERFDLAYGCVRRVLHEFCQSGELENMPKRGFFVRKNLPLEANVTKIGILAPSKPDPGGLIETARAAIGRYALQLGYVLWDIPTDPGFVITAENYAAISQCGALVLLGEYDMHSLQLPENIPAAGMLLHDDFNGSFSTVELDPFHSAQLATKYFLQNHIRKVFIFANNCPVNWNRCNIFAYHWKHAGGQFRFFGEDDNHAELSDFSPNIGCFFGEDDGYRWYATQYAECFGRPMFPDIPIFSVGGKCFMCKDYLQVPSHVANWRLLGISAFEEAINIMNNPLRKPRRIYLTGSFRVPTTNKTSGV